jgi:uncharacterized membrane protein YccC
MFRTSRVYTLGIGEAQGQCSNVRSSSEAGPSAREESCLYFSTLRAPVSAQPRRLATIRLAKGVWTVAPGVVFGLRLWVSVCLALYAAFWLELDNAYWAGASAAVVCQASLGASIRKGWFRMIGTVVGAGAIVALTAFFPQQRACFLLGLAFWGAACALVATLLRNFAAYSAALAGFTAAIIASDELGAVGGPNGDAFMLALTRTSEICIGILSAGVVLAGTDMGGSRRRLLVRLGETSAEISSRFVDVLLSPGRSDAEALPVRRDLTRRVIALDPAIDETLGETPELRAHTPILQAAVAGLFTAVSAWQISNTHLGQLSDDESQREAALIRDILPRELRPASGDVGTRSWEANLRQTRRSFVVAAKALVALPTREPSLRLLADQAIRALTGMSRAVDASALLAGHPVRTDFRRRPRRFPWLFVPDGGPAIVNALRALLTICVLELFWIFTGWPNGAQAIAFAAIAVIVFTLKGDQAYSAAVSFIIGASMSAAFAAIVKFAVLPSVTTFFGFSLAIGAVLAPAGALMTQSRQAAMFTAIVALFIPLLAPANATNYDLAQFYNSVLAVSAGVGAGALAFCLLPPLSPALRTRRLLARTRRDLRRLGKGSVGWSSNDWEQRVYQRFTVLPDAAEQFERAQLVAALSVGSEMIRLRRLTHRFDLGFDFNLDLAFDAVSRGESAVAAKRLSEIDRMLAALPSTWPGARSRLRARGSVLAISEALLRHAPYFDSQAVR